MEPRPQRGTCQKTGRSATWGINKTGLQTRSPCPEFLWLGRATCSWPSSQWGLPLKVLVWAKVYTEVQETQRLSCSVIQARSLLLVQGPPILALGYYYFYFMYLCLKIYLFLLEDRVTERRKERERMNLPFSVLLLKCLKWLGLARAKGQGPGGRNKFWISSGFRGPSTWIISCCFLRKIGEIGSEAGRTGASTLMWDADIG